MIHALIIVALIIVAITAYSVGKDYGIDAGRIEILKENLIREENSNPCMNGEAAKLINQLTQERN